MRYIQKAFTLNIPVPESLPEAEDIIVKLTTELATKNDTIRILSIENRELNETLTSATDKASQLHNKNVERGLRIHAIEAALIWTLQNGKFKDDAARTEIEEHIKGVEAGIKQALGPKAV